MKVVISGATGFLGRHVAWQLISDGHEVHNLESRTSSRAALESDARGKLVKPIIYNYRYENLYTQLRAIDPDCGIHLAARIGGIEDEAQIADMLYPALHLPVVMGKAILDGRNGGLILCGTNWQTSGNSNSFQPFDFYAGTKQAADDLLRGLCVQGLRGVSLRLFDCYGAYDKRRKILNLMLDSALRQQSLPMSPGLQKLDFIHVEDAARAFASAVAQISAWPTGSFNIYGVGTGQLHTLREVADIITELTGRTAPIKWGDRNYRNGEIMVPFTQLPNLPGWEAKIELREGISSMLKSRADA